MPSQTCGARATGGLVAALLCGFITAGAAEPPTGRGGGLVPASKQPRVGLTREELLREWDLDGDGTISKPEADVARGRMRRQRLDMQLGAGVDPITGLPRSITPEPNAAAEGEDDEPVYRLPPETPPHPKPEAEAAPPGMRAPPPARADPAVGGSTATPPPAVETSPSPGGQGGPSALSPKPALSSRASWLPAQPMAPATAGGVRAGAPAAVPGYGAGPWSGLNAGRRPPAPAVVGRRPDRNAGRGGLVPQPRLPGRTGAVVIPNAGTIRPPVGPPAPTTPSVPEPRITAEEIGGYRP